MKRVLKKKTAINKDIKEPSEKTGKSRCVKLKKYKKPVKPPLRHLKRYVKQRCAFVYPDGHKCNHYAVGKGTLCKKHNGDPIIKENLTPMKYESAMIPFMSKYDPAVHPLQFIDLSRDGMSKVEIAAYMEVSAETLQNWAEKFESFHLATEIGNAMHESWWLAQGKGGLNSRNFNTGLFKFLTSNKLGYSDKMETKSTNLTLHGVLVAPDAVTEDEWENEGVIDV